MTLWASPGRWVRVQLAVGVRPGISRVFENGVDVLKAGRIPADFFIPGRAYPAGQLEGLVAQGQQDLVGAAQAFEFGKDVADGALDLLIGVEGHTLVRDAHQPNRQAQVQFAAFGFVEFGRSQLGAQRIPLRLRKGTFEPQQQAVIIDAWVVDPAAVADQRAAQGWPGRAGGTSRRSCAPGATHP